VTASPLIGHVYSFPKIQCWISFTLFSSRVKVFCNVSASAFTSKGTTEHPVQSHCLHYSMPDDTTRKDRRAPQDRQTTFGFLSRFTRFLLGYRQRNKVIAASDRVECIACGDNWGSPPKNSFRAPCGHHYCQECITNFAKAFTRDESLYPLQCCRMKLSAEQVAQKFPEPLRKQFLAKSKEYSTPPGRRVYCANQKCSAFVCSSDTTNTTCHVCGTTTCLECKNRRHPGQACADSGVQQDLKDLVDKKKWQTCPVCRAIVERRDGCNYLACRCSTAFCYECGARYHQCFCW